MPVRPMAIVLGIALAGAIVFALVKSDPAKAPESAAERAPEQAAAPAETPAAANDSFRGRTLPPNHPPIDQASSGAMPALPADHEAPAITWKVPASWQTAPNPNPMRLATYHVSPNADGAEMSVTRAGGGAEANIQRWIGQFENAKDTHEEKTVHGLKITLVTIDGDYAGGGMMMGAGAGEPQTKKGWSLLGAIVDTEGMPYFFKLTGPSATIHAARAAFNGLVESITPAPPAAP